MEDFRRVVQVSLLEIIENLRNRVAGNAQSCATFFCHSAVLSLSAVLLRKVSNREFQYLSNDDSGPYLWALGSTCCIEQRFWDGIIQNTCISIKLDFELTFSFNLHCCCNCLNFLLPVQFLLSAFIFSCSKALYTLIEYRQKITNMTEVSIFVDFLTFRAMDEYKNANESEKERFLPKHHFQSLLINLL